MSSDSPTLTGPDLTAGIPLSQLRDGGMLAGHAFGSAVLLSRAGDELLAVESTCTHYGAPLAEGLLVNGTVRCPWHHACFDLRTGEAVRAPALRPLARFDVERRGDSVFVTGKSPGEPPRRSPPSAPERIVIIGAGAAADAAADVLRREGFDGSVTMIGAETDAPYDRPNLSKDFLAGSAPEEWIPLRPQSFYTERDITMALGSPVTAIDVARRTVSLENGASHGFDRLLIASGASPIRLPDHVAGGQVRYLRSLADSRDVIAAASQAKRAVIVGASFIGLEVAASLRQRELDVHVVAPEAHPLERVMGRALSDQVRARHESNGVVFHLGRTVAKVARDGVTLDDGTRVAADLVVAGIGVRPNDALAKAAGLAVDNGIIVDEHLETSAPGIFAAGDVARYPDRRTGERIRVEHWVVAQRQGQTVARNMLGHRERFDAVPFFWSVHPDMQISYVGHASEWDATDIDGDLAEGNARVTYRKGGRTRAVATVGRDRASLDAEIAMERESFTGAGR
jgi:NADPH-dependent 2,4-dienoyl-CoA reductase/sulfur reductase-like enzyme/nitrite reductase/ring-hydroxylating ferredoxin subunit